MKFTCALSVVNSMYIMFTLELWHFFIYLIAFADLFRLLLLEEAFIKVMKLSLNILEADSVHINKSLAVLLFNQLDLVCPWTQRNIDDILWNGNHMTLHGLTNKMVPDTNSITISGGGN